MEGCEPDMAWEAPVAPPAEADAVLVASPALDLLDALASLRFGLSFTDSAFAADEDSGFAADAERVDRAASGVVFAAVFVSDFGFAADAAALVFAAPAEDEPSFRGASWLAAALA